jgi:hypothetical protein
VKIDNSNILLGSQRSYKETNEDRTEFRFWVNPQQDAPADTVSISAKAQCMQSDGADCQGEVVEPEMDFEVFLRKLIAELLAGHKIRIVRLDRKSDAGSQVPVENTGSEEQSENGSVGWGLDYKEEHVHREKEDVGFTARGIIKTSDGKEIKFTLQLEMNRETVESDTLRIRAGDALKDPLVINLDGTAAELTDQSFAFDIDSDGTEENLPGLSQGRGYLALDLNNDGVINNGGELFGPESGNGFQELAEYDTDGNQWIDENDAVYSRLSVFNMYEKGTVSLHSLQSLGIGAVYLPNRSTLFDLKDRSGSELLGRVKASGIFIRDDGTAGTVQQIDLKV